MNKTNFFFLIKFFFLRLWYWNQQKNLAKLVAINTNWSVVITFKMCSTYWGEDPWRFLSLNFLVFQDVYNRFYNAFKQFNSNFNKTWVLFLRLHSILLLFYFFPSSFVELFIYFDLFHGFLPNKVSVTVGIFT